jgi:hypothetical protein
MWLPTVAELLKVLREQMEFWADRLGTTTDDVEYWCEEAAKKIAAFEARAFPGGIESGDSQVLSPRRV